jgi:SAM-dependent methyltransferase
VTIALDFGAGDGWFANQLVRLGLAKRVIPADVLRQRHLVEPPVLFDGQRLPFGDRRFDLTYSVDVLHHCTEPEAAIGELLRCTNRYCLVKDHTYQRAMGKMTLSMLDELGNRRFGVLCPRNYQKGWSWNRYFEAEGFSREALVHPAPCHSSVLGLATNHLQFLSLWRRKDP